MNKRKTVPPKTQGETSVWEKHNLPVLEYCDLHRAAKLLNCKVDDLLHWAEIGAIELCLKCTGFEALLEHTELTDEYRENPAEWVKNRFAAGYFDKYLTNKRSKHLSGMMSIQGPEPKINDNGTFEQEYALLCYLYGIWGLIAFRYNNLFALLKSSNAKLVTGLNFRLKPADEDLTEDLIQMKPSAELLDEFGVPIEPTPTSFTITPSDLLITRKQIEKIFNYKGKVIPNYINGGIDSPQEIDSSAITEEINLNKNKLGDLIDMLISAVPELGPAAAHASTNKKRDLLIAFLTQKQALGELVDYNVPGYDTFSKYFKL